MFSKKFFIDHDSVAHIKVEKKNPKMEPRTVFIEKSKGPSLSNILIALGIVGGIAYGLRMMNRRNRMVMRRMRHNSDEMKDLERENERMRFRNRRRWMRPQMHNRMYSPRSTFLDPYLINTSNL